jgi:hypothetical protein
MAGQWVKAGGCQMRTPGASEGEGGSSAADSATAQHRAGNQRIGGSIRDLTPDASRALPLGWTAWGATVPAP